MAGLLVCIGDAVVHQAVVVTELEDDVVVHQVDTCAGTDEDVEAVLHVEALCSGYASAKSEFEGGTCIHERDDAVVGSFRNKGYEVLGCTEEIVECQRKLHTMFIALGVGVEHETVVKSCTHCGCITHMLVIAGAERNACSTVHSGITDGVAGFEESETRSADCNLCIGFFGSSHESGYCQ